MTQLSPAFLHTHRVSHFPNTFTDNKPPWRFETFSRQEGVIVHFPAIFGRICCRVGTIKKAENITIRTMWPLITLDVGCRHYKGFGVVDRI